MGADAASLLRTIHDDGDRFRMVSQWGCVCGSVEHELASLQASWSEKRQTGARLVGKEEEEIAAHQHQHRLAGHSVD